MEEAHVSELLATQPSATRSRHPVTGLALT